MMILILMCIQRAKQPTHSLVPGYRGDSMAQLLGSVDNELLGYEGVT